MSMLVHWEATRDAVRAKLAAELGDTLSEAELAELTVTLTNTAIEAYTTSVFKSFKPEPIRR